MLLSSGIAVLLLLLFWRLFGQAAFNWKHSWVLAVGCWLLAVTGLAPMPGPGAAVFIRAEARTADGCGHFDSFSGSERAQTRSLILHNITHTPQCTRLKRNARQLLLLLLLLFGSLDCPS